jgi:hypothetical protein
VTLSEYLTGRRILLRSPRPSGWVIAQIKRAVPSPFDLMNHGVSAGVFFGRLRLAWDVPFFSNGFRPIFRGRIVESAGRTEVAIVFGAPFFVRIFFVVWYFLLAVTSAVAVSSRLEGNAAGAGYLIFVLAFFWAAPPVFHYLFNRKADAHFDAMLDLLAREAELCPVTAR